jgi:predicted nucleic acid-binding protein
VAGPFLLDTNHLTYLLQRNSGAMAGLVRALTTGEDLLLSPIAYYELERWLRAREADGEDLTTVRADFLALVSRLTWTSPDEGAADAAAAVWVSLRQAGQHRPDDADCLLLGQAQRVGAVLVTSDRRMRTIASSVGVSVEDWYVP